MRIAVCAQDFNKFIADFQDRHVERPTTKVEDTDFFFFLFVQTIRQSGGSRFVNDPRNIQARNLSRVFRGLALSVVEVGRHCDHGLVDLVAKIVFCSFLEFAQNQRRNFRGRVFFSVDVNLHIIRDAAHNLVRHQLFFRLHFAMTATHKALNRINSILRICDRLTFGWFTNQCFALGRKGNHAGGRATTFLIRNHTRLAAFHDRNH